MTLVTRFYFLILLFIPISIFAQAKQSGFLFGYNREIPASTFYTIGYFYEYHRWSGELEIEVPAPTSNTFIIGEKSSFTYSLLSRGKIKPFLKTSIEIQNTKLSPTNHKTYSLFSGYMGLATQITIYKQYSLLLESLLGRRRIFYETPVSIWVPFFSAKFKYTLTN